MFARLITVGSVVVLLALYVSSKCCADQAKGDAESIDGTWLPAVAEFAGQKFPDEVRKSIKLVIDDGKYTVTVGDAVDRGTCNQDASAKPKALDITGIDGPNKGRTILAIYEVSGDTLRVCYDLSGNARPTEFKTEKDTQLFLVTYDRAKQ